MSDPKAGSRLRTLDQEFEQLHALSRQRALTLSESIRFESIIKAIDSRDGKQKIERRARRQRVA